MSDRESAFGCSRDAEGRFRDVAESAPALIWMADAAGQVTYVNHRHAELLGFPVETFVGDGWLTAIHGEDRATVEETWNHARAARVGAVFEYRVAAVDGDLRWLHCETAPRLEAGAFVGHLALATDITAAKIRLLQLEEQVEMRTAELAASNQRLLGEITDRQQKETMLLKLQRLDAVGQLTPGIAHDFNNLLQVIVGGLAKLERGIDPGKLHAITQMMLQAAERGAALTRQLLAFSRRQKVTPQAVDINNAIEGIRELLVGGVGGSVALELRLARGLWPALVDPTQVEMIVLNLAINARDAMEGGGRLTIETSNAVVRRERTRPEGPGPGDYVTVAVGDTGPGIPPDVLARVFEPFFTTKPAGRGSGLGLSQVLGFAREAGGGVAIETAPAKGTTVKVFLPRAAQAGATVGGATSAARPAEVASGATVLLVDDDDLVRRATAQMLLALGHRVLQAGGGRAALKVLRRRQIDLLIVDIAMPGMDGLELARLARATRPALPVIVATGLAGQDVLGRLATERVLAKPFSGAELDECVRSALGGGGSVA